MEDNRYVGLSAKALKNLQRNEFLRGIERGLQPIPRLEYSTQGAVFDAERIEPIREEKAIDGKKVLKFKFKYLIGVDWPPYDIGIRELIVDSKTSEKIDAYLSEGINVLDIQILRTPKGTKYKISHDDDFHGSIPGYQIPLPKDLTGDGYALKSHV